MTLRFDEFVFDGGRRQLFRGGEPVPLEPKAYDLLRLLISKRPDAVSKRDILEAIWPGSFVSESSLPGLVMDLRAVLGDDALASRFIRTVPRYGYAFCATVSETPHPATPRHPRAPRVMHEGQALQLSPGQNVLGRADDVAVRVDILGVSRHHARIVVDGDRFTLEDLGSKNGTFLHGQRLDEPAELTDGDRFRLGRTPLVFRSSGPAGPTETE